MANDETVRRKSRFFRRPVWLGLALVAVISVVAALLNPPTELLLGKFVKDFERRTGYLIEFGKSSRVKLFPNPAVVLRQVKIRRPVTTAADGGVFADAREVRAEFGFIGLLRGSGTVESMVVTEPNVTAHRADLRHLRLRFAKPSDRDVKFRIRDLAIAQGFVSYQTSGSNPDATISDIDASLTDVSADGIDRIVATMKWRDDPVSLEGRVVRDRAKRSSVLKVAIDTPKTKTTFQGTATGGAEPSLVGDLNVQVDSLVEFLQWLNLNLQADDPALASPAIVSGRLNATPEGLNLTGAQISTGIGQGKADVAIDLAERQPKLAGTIAWEYLDLGFLTPARPAAPGLTFVSRSRAPAFVLPNAWDELEDYLVAITRSGGQGLAPVESPGATAATPARSTGWSAWRYDLSTLRWSDINLVQSARKLVIRGMEFQGVQTESHLKAGLLNVELKRAVFAQGIWNGVLTLDTRPATYEVTLRGRGANVDVRSLQEGVLRRAVLEGRGDLTVDLSARGGSARALLSSLGGKANVTVVNGRLIGFDLKAVLNRWWRRWKYDDRRATKFDRVHARFRLNKGVLKTVGPATLRGKHVEIDSSGTVSLLKRFVNYKVRARLSPPPSALPFPVRIAGPWTAPRVKLDFRTFSVTPDYYELPQTLPVRAAGAGRSLSLSPADSAAREMPESLRDKIEAVLQDPQKAAVIPQKLRRTLRRLVER